MRVPAHISEHFLKHQLTPETKRALDRVKRGLVIEDRHERALIDAGYVRRALGGPMVTDLGRARLLVL